MKVENIAWPNELYIALRISIRNRSEKERSELLRRALESTSVKVDEKEKLMNLVLIIQRNCNHLRVNIANLIHVIVILTICLAKKILTMNSLTKMNLCKIIFHVKFSIKIILINNVFLFFLFLSPFLWSRNNISCF